MAERRRRRVAVTLRARVTLAATAVVLAVLAAGAVLFVVLLDARLVDAEHTAAHETAELVADRWDAEARLPAGLDEDAIVQVVRDGEVIAQTPEAADAGDRLPERDGARLVLDGEAHVVAVEEAEEVLVVAARPLESVGEATSATGLLLTGAVPALVALIALVVWIVAGRALRPVERMRRQVEAIGADELGRRVEAPPGAGELGALAATMNDLLDRIEVSQRAQRQFVADASHELRSPIASLRQHAEVALAYPESTDAAELAELVDAESLRLAELVDALLLLARSGEPGGIRHEAIDLDDLVLDEAARLRALPGATVEVTVEPARVRGDRALLARALRNLGDNARRHAASRIALSAHRDGEDAVIRIEDDGAGIAPQDRERVFERFVRLDEARAREDGGTGLGLAIVAEAALRHGGSVTAGAAPLGGARLELRLPLA